MPNTRSAAKRMRADAKRHLRNLDMRSELKTLVRRLRELLQAGKKSEAQEFFRLVSRRFDQAASRGVLHRNTASRKKSRLARHLLTGRASAEADPRAAPARGAPASR
ncbi:MAG: 30S ribosomal protein S20 [Candidatus Omnitrophica bacterium]|nr:30S ribosomal protein S20 [Candidatus Omnitrophota bacterium]